MIRLKFKTRFSPEKSHPIPPTFPLDTDICITDWNQKKQSSLLLYFWRKFQIYIHLSENSLKNIYQFSTDFLRQINSTLISILVAVSRQPSAQPLLGLRLIQHQIYLIHLSLFWTVISRFYTKRHNPRHITLR